MTPDNPQQWWQNLSDQWRWIFSENLKEKGKKTFFNAALAPKNLTISDDDLHRLLHQQHTLVAAYSQIHDISPLVALSGCLQNLYLNLNEIQDITPISHLRELRLLQIGGNQIRDISPLAPLSGSLKECQLNGNLIQNINTLSEFSQLENLELASNQIDDIAPLFALNHLRVLNLNHNPIKNLNSIHPNAWQNLRELSLLRVDLSPNLLNLLQQNLPNAAILHD